LVLQRVQSLEKQYTDITSLSLVVPIKLYIMLEEPTAQSN
jgi:hypothetical protein